MRERGPEMLLEKQTTPLKESSRVVLETERLVLRKPTLADVKALASLANDRRVVQNTSRLPHPYLASDAENFVKMVAEQQRDTTFLITRDREALGVAGLGLDEKNPPEIGYW